MSDTPLTDEEPCIKGSNIKWYELHPLTTSPHKEVKDWMKKATAAISFLEQQLKEANDELEVERMRLAGCSVAALGYFDGCDDKYKSASLDDVLSLYEQLKERDALLDEVLKAEALPSHPHSACYFYISQDLSNRIKNRNKP